MGLFAALTRLPCFSVIIKRSRCATDRCHCPLLVFSAFVLCRPASRSRLTPPESIIDEIIDLNLMNHTARQKRLDGDGRTANEGSESAISDHNFHWFPHFPARTRLSGYQCQANLLMIVNLICFIPFFLSFSSPTALILARISCAAGLCQSLAGPADSDGPTPAPKFITRGHLYKAVIGDTIILPCKVKDLGQFSDGSSPLFRWSEKSFNQFTGDLLGERN